MLKNKFMLLKNAFTLAEVLITLSIIGVVAAITIPTLLKNYKDIEYKTAYRKAFAVASQAWLKVKANSEDINLPSSGETTERYINFYYLMTNLKITKKSGDITSDGSYTLADVSPCWSTLTGSEQWWNNAPPASGQSISFVDISGMSWLILDVASAGGDVEFAVDTNGLKPPNKYGQDRFPFLVLSAENSKKGDLIKLTPRLDCLSTTDCETSANYLDPCPSVASHSCYFTSWLYN